MFILIVFRDCRTISLARFVFIGSKILLLGVSDLFKGDLLSNGEFKGVPELLS